MTGLTRTKLLLVPLLVLLAAPSLALAVVADDAHVIIAIEPAITHPVLGTFMNIAFSVLAISILLTAIRIARGPSVPDRIIALDVLGNLCAATIALTAIQAGKPVLLAIALVIALIIFLGTCAFSLYIERRARP